MKSGEPEPLASTLDDVPFPESICHRCSRARHVMTKTSRFVMCTALSMKYPRQPIVTCPAFDPRGPSG